MSKITAAFWGGIFGIFLHAVIGYFMTFNPEINDEWQCTASHAEGEPHNAHDVCDQYTRKEK